MYEYLQGKLVSKQLKSYKGTTIVVDVNGVGYRLLTTSRTINSIPELNIDAKVYVSLVHKEDSMTLCGFLIKEERDIFNILQSVSGVGVKLALLLLDEFDVSELINLVIHEDFKGLSAAKGVGPKLAQKIILELKDKLINWSNVSTIDVSDIAETKYLPADSVSEAQSVLLSLGYSNTEVKDAIKIVMGNKIKTPSNAEELLRYTLEYLAQH